MRVGGIGVGHSGVLIGVGVNVSVGTVVGVGVRLGGAAITIAAGDVSGASVSVGKVVAVDVFVAVGVWGRAIAVCMAAILAVVVDVAVYLLYCDRAWLAPLRIPLTKIAIVRAVYKLVLI